MIPIKPDVFGAGRDLRWWFALGRGTDRWRRAADRARLGSSLQRQWSTRSAAEAVRALAIGATPLAAGKHARIALVAETAADARDVTVEGESGILAVHPRVIGIKEPGGDEEQALQSLACEKAGRQLNLMALSYDDENRVELFEELGRANIALMLSWHEGFGLTVSVVRVFGTGSGFK
jgi:hypothetical protein